jgi:hypothetical protein
MAYTFTAQDEKDAAEIIYQETKGLRNDEKMEPTLSDLRKWIMHVIINRMNSGKYTNVAALGDGVIFAKHEPPTEKELKSDAVQSAWEDSRHAVKRALSQLANDPTAGCTHFYMWWIEENGDIDETVPAWAKEKGEKKAPVKRAGPYGDKSRKKVKKAYIDFYKEKF